MSNKYRLTAVDLQDIQNRLIIESKEFASTLLSYDMPSLLQEIKILRHEMSVVKDKLDKADNLLHDARITMNENCLYDCRLYDDIWEYLGLEDY